MAETYGARDLVGYGPTPPDPKWPGGAKIAISIVLNYEEGSEVSLVNGDPHSENSTSEFGPGAKKQVGERNVNMESVYEYGSRAGVWRIMRLFKEYGVKITAYAVGQALLLNPAVGKYFVTEGHEVTSHGWRWVDRSNWTVQEEEENVKKACEAIAQVAGAPPRGWYYGMVESQGGSRSREIVAKKFKEQGIPLKYYSDSYNDDLPYWITDPAGSDDGLLIIPYGLDTNDFREGSYSAFVTPDNIANYLIGTFDELYKEGVEGQPKMFSIGLHCRIVGRPGRLAGLRKFLEHTKKFEGVWFATREEIADHWSSVYPYKKEAS